MPADKKVMKELQVPSLEEAKSTHPADYVEGKVSKAEPAKEKRAPAPPKPKKK